MCLFTARQEYPTSAQCMTSPETLEATQVAEHHSVVRSCPQSWHNGASHCRPEIWHSGPSDGDIVQHEVGEFRQCTVGHSSSQAQRQGQFFHLN